MRLLAECSCHERFSAANDDVRHTFWLRPGLRVIIDLPPNLTYREADRFGRIVESLPFTQEIAR